MSHPYLAIARKNAAQRLGDEESTIEQLGGMVVDAMMPRLQERIPELAADFVDNAMPRVQQQIVNLEPQLRELAVSSANAVLSDPQIQETVKLAVQEQTQKTEAKLTKGLMLLGGVVIGANLLIEIAEPWLPGRKRR